MASDKLKDRLTKRISRLPPPQRMVELKDYDFQKRNFGNRKNPDYGKGE